MFPFPLFQPGSLLNAAMRGQYNTELSNYQVGDDAKALLADVRNRLGLLAMYAKPRYAPIDNNSVNVMLKNSLSALRSATEPLQVKKCMHDLNNELLLIVNNYFENMQTLINGSARMDHSQIKNTLTELSTLIRQQSYRYVHGVFCVVYDETSENYTTPVIHVTSTNFAPLLSVFMPNGFTILKFKQTPSVFGDYDWYIEMDSYRGPEKVSFIRFDVYGGKQSDAGFVSPYKTACINEPNIIYHWVCVKCQTLVKVHSHTGKIKCNCGVGDPPTVNPECLKCVRRL